VRLALFVSLAVACSNGAKREDGALPMPPPPPADAAVGPKVYLETPKGEVAVHVEVVASEAKIERGLMYRRHLALDAGMLFFMGYEKDHSFWMRNTLIPLDMIFITKDMRIAGIVENAEPKTEVLRKVGKPSLYVLEVNGGWTKSSGVFPGARVRFENVTPK
jgi:uncharacterized protein